MGGTFPELPHEAVDGPCPPASPPPAPVWPSLSVFLSGTSPPLPPTLVGPPDVAAGPPWCGQEHNAARLVGPAQGPRHEGGHVPHASVSWPGPVHAGALLVMHAWALLVMHA